MKNVTANNIALKQKDREQIKNDVEAFIKNGGKVEKLKSGKILMSKKAYGNEPMI